MVTASVMPPLLWQTRFEPTECEHEIAKHMNNQGINPSYKDPLNGRRVGSIIRCRKNRMSSDFFGYPPINLGEPRYTGFLSRSIMESIKAYHWLDDMTDKVTLAMIVYTPGLESLSLLCINFKIAESGRVHVSYELKTHSNFADREDRTVLILLNVLILLITLLSLSLDLHAILCKNRSKRLDCISDDVRADGICRRFGFDVWLAVAVLAFCIASLCRRYNMCALLDQVQPLWKLFYEVNDTNSQEQVANVQATYMEVFDEVIQRVRVEDIYKGIAYVIIVMSIVRLIMHLSIHPRIGFITQTVVVARDNIVHFLFVMILVCSILAWIGWWSFGPDNELFSTYFYALDTIAKMVLGEFPVEEPWKESRFQTVWMTLFTFLVFFLAVNIGLSIIVDAFQKVKNHFANECRIHRSVVVDVCVICHISWLQHRNSWPWSKDIEQHLQVYPKQCLTARDLHEAFDSKQRRFKCESDAKTYMDIYHWYLDARILPPKKGRAPSEGVEVDEGEDTSTLVGCVSDELSREFSSQEFQSQSVQRTPESIFV